MSEADFLEYLNIQGSPEMVTKTELIEGVRSYGETISDRTLTYYTSQGLIPRAVRVGSRSGAYPKIVEELVVWLIRCRKRELSLEALRELVPLWGHLMKARREGIFDLGEIQYLARSRVHTNEANAEVPWVINEVLRSMCLSCVSEMRWILKDGTEVIQSADKEIAISFILAELDEERQIGRPLAWTQLVLPGFGEILKEGPATIILGIPNNVDLELEGNAGDCTHSDREATDREEVFIR